MLYGAFITKNGEAYTIGNSFLSRTFLLDGDKSIKTSKIINFRTDTPTDFVPDKASEEFIVTLDKKKRISASHLKVKSVQETNIEGFEKCLEIIFEPYSHKGAVLSFKELVFVNSDDFFMRKRIYMHVDKKSRRKIVIDSIDFEHFVFDKSEVPEYWSHPAGDKKDILEFNRSLGQPVYINGFFIGCEFPVTDNRAQESGAFIRYYSGKSFQDINKDETDCFVSANIVLGAAQSVRREIVKSDFLSYIKTVSLPDEFTVQYSTGFDLKNDISEKSTVKSFFEIEKGLSQNGVKPLSSFVIDRGWHDEQSSFWSFKQEFPNGLTTLSRLSEIFYIPLGMWLGISGDDQEFAKRVEMGGKGYINKKTKEVCASTPVYQKNLIDFISDCMNKYNINCWYFDNFPSKPCNNKNHNHIVGGFNDMYYTSELWEFWLCVIEDMRKKALENEKKLWIVLGQNAVMSPWILQWVNCVWLQNSEKLEFIYKNNKKKELGGSETDALITYRDDRYYNLLKTRQLQFPLANIFSGDPIYAKKAGFKTNTSNYRKYMYMAAMKGSTFWQLNYSPSMLNDDKWRINSDILKWAEKNREFLSVAEMVGGIPSFGEVYGYSAWKNGEGIVALRNPSDLEQSFTVTLDTSFGVSSQASELYKTAVLPFNAEKDENKYKYGDCFEVTVKPHDVCIYKFLKTKERAPRIVWEKTADEQTVMIAFDKPVIANAENYTINGEPALDCFASADNCQVRIRAKEKFIPNSTVKVKLTNVADTNGNTVNSELQLTYFVRDVVFEFENKGSIISGDITFDKSFTTDNDFSICIQFSETGSNKLIVHQGNEYYVSVDTAGKLRFYAKEIGIVSKAYVNTGENICATLVCESNGMLKIYINGKLDASYYRKNVGCPVIEPLPISANCCVDAFRIVNRAYSYDEIPDMLVEIGKNTVNEEEPQEEASQEEVLQEEMRQEINKE